MCIDCNDNLMLPPLGQANQPGNDGQSAYVYIASASSSSGANFTYPAALDDPGTTNGKFWISIIQSTTPLTPAASDFTTWDRVVGSNGTNGTNGTDGTDGIFGGVSFEYKFLGYGLSSASNPTSGFLSLAGATNAATTSMAISEFDTNAIDLSSVLSLFYSSTNVGVKSLIKITDKTDSTKYVVYSIGGGSDPGTFRTLTSLTYLGGSTAPLTNGSDVLVSISIVGDKGSQGAAGPAGAFIIGTLSPAACVGASATCFAAGKIYFPVPASGGTITQGSAYRFISNGIVTDGVNEFRVFNNDVLYCTGDITSTTPSYVNWFIWHGYPRAFKPGNGLDCYVQNTSGVGSAVGDRAIAFNNNNSVAGNDSAAFGDGNSVPGTRCIAFGGGHILNGQDNVALGEGHTSNAVLENSLLAGTSHDASAIALAGGVTQTNVAAFGNSHNLGTYANNTLITGEEGKIQFPATLTLAGGKFATKGDNQIIIANAATFTNNTYKARDLSTWLQGYGLYNSQLVMPSNSIWKVKAEVISYNITSSKTCIWDVHFTAKCVGGIITILDKIYIIPPSGVPTYNNVAAITAPPNPPGHAADGVILTTSDALYEDYGAAAVELAIYVDSAGTRNILHFTCDSTSEAPDVVRWNSKVEITQLGWF